jgi:GDP/UDP-N,N'-diacetylbacillosamine 2-epimerase (hydrolysing)
MRKICVVTGSRADYDLLRGVMEKIQESTVLQLQLAVTGAHLSPEFGLTVKIIEADGFCIIRKIEMLISSDTSASIAKSTGIGIIGFADALADLKPDLLLVLGDRYEIFSAVVAAMIARIPIAHIHGGEKTEGAFDESIRHSISKMSHLHFVASNEYRNRVIQLGEDPKKVFNVGGLGVDNILRTNLLSRDELENALRFKLLNRNLLITFHSVTLENDTSSNQIDELLAALATLEDIGLVFTMPNADTDGRILFDKIKDFCAKRHYAIACTSLGQTKYFSCIHHFDGIVGNSSSGLTEVPSFNKGTINIGDRQRGRTRSTSVINCAPERSAIIDALQQLLSCNFTKQLREVKNPYGSGGASAAIVAILEREPIKGLIKKEFFDISHDH